VQAQQGAESEKYANSESERNPLGRILKRQEASEKSPHSFPNHSRTQRNVNR
jgi:hypothetical protein